MSKNTTEGTRHGGKNGKKIWTTKDGRELLISEMETSHIENSINMMKKNRFIAFSTLKSYLSAPCNKMGDGAQLAFDQEFDFICDCRINIKLDWLEEELKNRT